MLNNYYIDIYPGLRIIPENEKDNIYPAGIIRIVVTEKYMKINCGLEFSIFVDIHEANESAKSINWDGNIDHIKMAEKYGVCGGEYRITATDEMLGLSDEISCDIEKMKKQAEDLMLVRLRTIELINIIDRDGMKTGQKLPASDECSPYQAKIARSIYSYLMKHMEKHITIEELAGLFKLSKTQIKESFKSYYGGSVFRYIRKEKIMIAAHMLQKNDRSISCIAEECGYTSVSKFSSAFCKIMQVTPSKYRSMT